MTDTKIEWTDLTWNPVTGCTKVSPGCDHCYAEGIARRFAGSKAFPNGFDVTLHPERLDQPFRWRKPSRVFVNSMSDLFHADVPDVFIARVWAVMAATPQHTYQVLTKRAGRMRSLMTSARMGDPLPNVWLGVSAEDQHWADIRISALLDTPAAVRFVSAEPLIGSLKLATEWADLDWVIVGGESGAGARPMDLAWARSLVNDCRALGVAPFVKQLGSRHGAGKGGDMSTWPSDLRVREFPERQHSLRAALNDEEET